MADTERQHAEYVPACQSLLDDDTRCPEIATHIVKGRPGYRWYGVHCEHHASVTATHYDHQGGCVVVRIDGVVGGTDYGPGAEDVDDSPEYHAARSDGDGCGS